jgi:hypothetical protein
MERLERDLLETFCRANSTLASFFRAYSGQAVQGSTEELQAMLGVERILTEAGRLLRHELPRSADPEVRRELAIYRENLLRLRAELGAMQQSASAAQAHITVRRKHLDSARQWCAASRDTG